MRKIVADIDKRIETGPLQINNDWPGVFIRGDHAAHIAMNLEMALETATLDPFVTMSLEGLLGALKASRIDHEKN